MPQQQQTHLQVAGTFYTGPIPQPQALAEYEHIHPGLANRLVTMAENEQAHRHRIVSRRSWAQIWITVLGQIFGFTVAVMTIGIGGFLLYNDKQLAGFVSLIGGLATLLGAFIYRRTRTRPQSTQ